MAIAFLATGDEIIHGDTLNTNSHYLAQILSSEGLPLGLHLTASDKETEILSAIEFLSASHDCLIIIGGLGPTSDDRTRFALSRFLQEPLIEFSEALEHISSRLKRINLPLNEGNKQQALFPKKAIILPNPNGTAVGCYYEQQQKTFILLPGPPSECLPMFSDYVLPHLQKKTHSQKEIVKWRLFGVAEGQIADQIDKALAGIDCQTGYRLETPYVECKVRCKKELVPKVKERLSDLLNPYIIAPLDKKASRVLFETLLTLKQSITLIDEVSGGLLQSLIQKPETYPWLNFQLNDNENYYFHLQGLQEYWSNKEPGGFTKLSIKYNINGQEGQETHEIPYRGPHVVIMATEFLSFRLFELINKFH